MGRKYIFTDKRESKKGVMSTALGLIALVSVAAAVYATYRNQGQAMIRYGMAVLFALLFSLVGIVLGVMAKWEKDRFHVFSWLGIVLNLLVIAGISFILYAGVYGL